jgi:hypothetical protein
MMLSDQPFTIAAPRPVHRRGFEKLPPRPVWPAEVDLILSAMEAARQDASDRRIDSRLSYRVRAMLKLFSDAPEQAPWTLYTRDADTRGLGFITSHRLPLGYGGHVELLTPSGAIARIQCTLFRCREAVPGWFEGALYFNREQPDFAMG